MHYIIWDGFRDLNAAFIFRQSERELDKPLKLILKYGIEEAVNFIQTHDSQSIGFTQENLAWYTRSILTFQTWFLSTHLSRPIQDGPIQFSIKNKYVSIGFSRTNLKQLFDTIVLRETLERC